MIRKLFLESFKNSIINKILFSFISYFSLNIDLNINQLPNILTQDLIINYNCCSLPSIFQVATNDLSADILLTHKFNLD